MDEYLLSQAACFLSGLVRLIQIQESFAAKIKKIKKSKVYSVDSTGRINPLVYTGMSMGLAIVVGGI